MTSQGEEKFLRMPDCPVCGSTSLTDYKQRTFDYHTLNQEHIKITDSDYGKTWDLSRCSSCTHIFANPSPKPDFIQSLYGQIEDPVYEEEARGREKNFQRILAFLDKILPQQGTLYDVGAATGILMNAARQRGWQVDGIEPSLWAVGVAEKKYGLKLRAGDFQSTPGPQHGYSVVSMVDFIEHIPEPQKAMHKAYQILAPEGIVCLVTPNIKSLAARFSGRRWWHFRPAHLNYFTKTSLHALLDRTGFSILKIRRYSWTFSAHYLLSRHPIFQFLIKNKHLASFWKRFPIKLVLGDSLEVYARKQCQR